MQRTLECSVCSDFYVPGTRPPKTLSCDHSFCSPCLHILYTDLTIKCPKCRATCTLTDKIENLPTNYTVLEMLDSVCGECHNQPHNGRCSHCDKNVCDSCREVHKATPKSASKLVSSADYNTLKSLIAQLNDKLADDRPLKDITTRRDRAVQELTQIKDEQINLIEKQFNEKISEVKGVAQEDIKQLITHNGEIRSLLTEANTLLDNVQNHRYLGANGGVRFKEDVDRIVQLLKDFENGELLTSTFDCSLNRDEFMAGLSESFKLLITRNDGTNMVSQRRSAPDYTRFECRSVFKDGLKGAVGVCVNPSTGHLIVTDCWTNRVHILSDDLELIHTFIPGGETGSCRHPYGVACDGDAIYIADSSNRVCVTDTKGNQVREFSTKGSEQDNLNVPNSLAMDSTGHVYVCDCKSRKVNVTTKDGSFLRQFGQQIFGEENPHFISVSLDNKVAVTDYSGNLYLFTTSGQHIRTIKGKTPPRNIEATAAIFDGHGNLVVTDLGGRVLVMSETGEVRGVISWAGTGRGELGEPRGLAITTKGELVVCDYGNRRIQLFSAK